MAHCFFDVKGDVLNRIGESEKLKNLSNRLNDGEEFDVQKELEELCRVISVKE